MATIQSPTFSGGASVVDSDIMAIRDLGVFAALTSASEPAIISAPGPVRDNVESTPAETPYSDKTKTAQLGEMHRELDDLRQITITTRNDGQHRQYQVALD